MPWELGIHSNDIRRTTSVLQHDRSEPVNFDYHKQDDGFYMLKFKDIDYDEFMDIVKELNRAGVTTIGDDDLQENKIMKLTDLLKEQEEERPNRMESADDIIAKLEKILETWETKEYESDEARWNEYYLDIEELVEDFKENQSIDRPDTDIQEQKLRKLIQKVITEWRK